MQILILAVFAGVAVWQRLAGRRSGSARLPAATGFGLWALAGLVAALALLSGLSIGLFIAPVAAVLLGLAGRFAPQPASVFGVLAGAGVLLAAVAVWSDWATGPDPRTWSLLGLAFVLAGGAGFLLLRKRA